MVMSMLVQRFNKLLHNASLVECLDHIQDRNLVNTVAEDALTSLKPVVITVSADVHIMSLHIECYDVYHQTQC